MPDDTPASDTSKLLDFMYRLAQAYLASGEQTAIVESYLRQIALANGMVASRVVTFPTAVLIVLNDGKKEHVTMAEGPNTRLRLDQIADVYTLGSAARSGAVSPSEGLARLTEILAMKSRFGPIGTIIGHTILTVGLAIVQMPTLVNMAIAAILGAIVGTLKVFNRDQPFFAAPLSVVSAMLVSILVFLAVDYGLPIDPVYALVPPLVTFLPGAMLAFALVELTYGDMVSGSSRLLTGVVQLVLLAFGLAAGATLVGYTPDHLLDGPQSIAVPWWALMTGVLVFGVGIYFHFSAPRKSLPWMLLVMFAAFGAQRLSSRYVGPEMSGFFGMLAATPLGNLIQYRFKGAPSMVTFLPSFWLLVPGVLGLLSIKRFLIGTAGLEGVISVLFAFTAIALGTLVGESFYHWVAKQLKWD